MRYKFIVKGIIQGVGFRPTVYKIAKKLNLKGYVLNSSKGVIIEVEGKNASKFIDELKINLPPLARIDSIKTEILKEKNYKDFEIKESVDGEKVTFISPDIAVCEDCLKEMFDKNDRRYLYPFINCTNCGPRYTIIKNIPYDRKNTSMAKFKMCNQCKKEYENPLDRRYHAQPISCYNCGPVLEVRIKNETFEKKKFKKEIEKIEFIAELIKQGKIVAVKGLGGFHLICNATDEEAVKTLRQRKRRPYKPFAMMFKNIETIKKYCAVTKEEENIILSKEKPIVLVKKRKELSLIAPDIDKYGVFLPYTPLHYLLFEFIDFPIVATSANISDEPIIRSSEELEEKLYNVVDAVLDYNREIINACDDSVVQVIDKNVSVMRCARGYAPLMHEIKSGSKNILATGANQKNTISLVLKNRLIFSPHIGDLGTVGSIEYFERTIQTFKRLYKFQEDVIICDKHPYYESTKWAKKQNKEIYQIQHHYAHALSTMYEYDINEKCLAFVFDGTGYGDDGAIWGGEIFLADRHNYDRIGHFKYFKLIGAEKGVKNPANTAVSLIDDNLAKNFPNYKLAKTLKNASFPLTSSMGRIFDMIAFLAGMVEKNEYEGYTGLLIEKYFDYGIKDYIDLKIENNEVDFIPLLNFAAEKRGDFKLISSVFLNSIAKFVVKTSKEYGLKTILSGGVFQNKTLVNLIKKELNNVFINNLIPVNDAGVSVGQAMWGVWNLD